MGPGLIEVDRALTDAMIFAYPNASHLGGPHEHVQFQFPPKITAESRKGDWNEVHLRSDQPNLVYMTSGPREIKLEWTYIVGVKAPGGTFAGAWTTRDVKNQVSGLRNYYSSIPHKGRGEGLAILYVHWLFGNPTSAMSVIMRSMNFTHGTTIVVPDGNAEEAYPLRTDCSAELRLWTKAGLDNTEDDIEIKMDIEKVKPGTPPQWV